MRQAHSQNRVRVVTLVGLALVLAGAEAGAAPPVAAATLGCGQLVTHSTTLTANVGPCNSGDGLVVGASGITLNLNNYKVFSTAPLPRTNGTDAMGNPIPADVVGVHLVNVSGVTVRGGTVQGFAAGVAIEGGGSNVVRNMVVQANQGPCVPEVNTQLVGKFGDGIVLFSSSNNKIFGNVADSNAPYSGISVVTETDPITNAVTGALPTGNFIANNSVRNHALCRAEQGIRVEGPGATKTTVSSNLVDGTDVEGIAVEATVNIDFSVPGCSTSPFDPGLLCPTFNPPQPINQGNVISGNLVTRAGVRAGPVRSGIGLLNFFAQQGYLGTSGQPSVFGANNNSVQLNVVTGNMGNGIGVNSSGNRIISNVVVNNNLLGCPRPPPVPPNSAPSCLVGPFGGPYTPRFDLFDGNGVSIVPSNPPPPPPPAVWNGFYVVLPGAVACDSNLWLGNTYRTASPSCTTTQFSRPRGAGSAPTITATGLATGMGGSPAAVRLRSSPSARPGARILG